MYMRSTKSSKHNAIVLPLAVGVLVAVAGIAVYVSNGSWDTPARPAPVPAASSVPNADRPTVPTGWAAASKPVNGIAYIYPQGWSLLSPANGTKAFAIVSPDYRVGGNGEVSGTKITIDRTAKMQVDGHVVNDSAELKYLTSTKGAKTVHSPIDQLTVAGRPAIAYTCGVVEPFYHCHVVISDTDNVVISTEPVTMPSLKLTRTFMNYLSID